MNNNIVNANAANDNGAADQLGLALVPAVPAGVQVAQAAINAPGGPEDAQAAPAFPGDLAVPQDAPAALGGAPQGGPAAFVAQPAPGLGQAYTQALANLEGAAQAIYGVLEQAIDGALNAAHDAMHMDGPQAMAALAEANGDANVYVNNAHQAINVFQDNIHGALQIFFLTAQQGGVDERIFTDTFNGEQVYWWKYLRSRSFSSQSRN
ncbi:unnamed protein product [Peniophora sp. CBMAI 1063]|nr:unnamed protein product [Peniophora sp. CBMAI 1063]